jgi:hypothetical protein
MLRALLFAFALAIRTQFKARRVSTVRLAYLVTRFLLLDP